jgi:hypothetical protein
MEVRERIEIPFNAAGKRCYEVFAKIALKQLEEARAATDGNVHYDIAYTPAPFDAVFDAEGSTLTQFKELCENNFAELADTKVDKIEGKGLSTNDYTTTEKNKLAGIAENATANVKTTLTPLVAGTAAIGNDTGFAVIKPPNQIYLNLLF